VLKIVQNVVPEVFRRGVPHMVLMDLTADKLLKLKGHLADLDLEVTP
jgi:hypothetical protein